MRDNEGRKWCEYLDSDSVNPVALDAQLKWINADEPVGTGVDSCHDANDAVISVEESPRYAVALALWHGWTSKSIQYVRRIATCVQTVGSTCLDILRRTGCQSFSQAIQGVCGIVCSTWNHKRENKYIASPREYSIELNKFHWLRAMKLWFIVNGIIYFT